jgi:hypothetical protein
LSKEAAENVRYSAASSDVHGADCDGEREKEGAQSEGNKVKHNEKGGKKSAYCPENGALYRSNVDRGALDLFVRILSWTEARNESADAEVSLLIEKPAWLTEASESSRMRNPCTLHRDNEGVDQNVQLSGRRDSEEGRR